MTEKYKPFESRRFRKGRKLAVRQGLDMAILKWGIEQLACDVPLPSEWRDHKLSGRLQKFRECHIGGSADWLLIYEKRERYMILYLFNIGSHAEMFE